MEEDKTIKRKKTFKIIYRSFLWLIIVLLLTIVLGLSFLMILAKVSDKNNKTPFVGLYTVTNESMSPKINAYDVVLTLKTNVNNLKKDDIVTYYSLNIFNGFSILTNRVVEVNEDNTIIVKGASDNDVPETIVQPNIIGKVIFVVPKIGNINGILSSKSGWLSLLLIPIIIVIIYDIYKFGKVVSMRKRISSIQNEHGNI
jgi:signal peptidase